MNLQRKRLAAALGVGGVALFAVGSVAAQDLKVNVTGSNIRKVESEAASPIETISRADIEASGLNTISEVVRQITAANNGNLANSWSGVGFPAGASGVSLRGLGLNNTLVLLNGRRLAVYGLADDGKNSFVDLNQIPMDIVDRIDILKSGASAVYGSDAVAGVVNIITRQQFTGGAISAQGGITSKSDGTNARGSLTLGTGDLTKDRYNMFVTFDAQGQKAIDTTKRGSYIGSHNLTGLVGQDWRPGTLGTNDYSLSSSSIVGNVRRQDPDTGDFGAYQSLPGCAPANLVDGLCAYEYKKFLQIEPKTEKFNIFARGSYNFTDTTQGYAELSWFQSKLWAQGTPLTTNGAWYSLKDQQVISAANTIMPAGNPANPFPGADARLRYAFGGVGGDIGATFQEITTNTQRYLAGVKGTNWDWDWDAAALYIQSKTSLDLSNYVNYPNLLNALAGQGGFGYYQPGAAAVNNKPRHLQLHSAEAQLQAGQQGQLGRVQGEPRSDEDGRRRDGARAGRRISA